MVFHLSFSDDMFPHVSKTLLRILAVLKSAVVSAVSDRRQTSKSSTLPTPPLGQDMTQGQFLSGV